MDKALKEKWVKALRSGKYKQTEGRLRRHVSGQADGTPNYDYCCLGVLADIIDSHGWEGESEHIAGDQGDRLIPKTCGIRSSTQSTLINMNDGGDCDFKDIANYIEKRIKGA